MADIPATEDDAERSLFIDEKELLACSFDKWYSLMRKSASDKHTFRSSVIPLEDEFIAYLEEDGVRLPLPPVNNELLRARDPRKNPVKKDDDDCSDWSSDSCANDDAPILQHRIFNELEENINKAIEDLGGEVFVKLNWTSPRDADWMGGGSLSCATPGEIFLLLKASDLCQHDLSLFRRAKIQPILVLRKYVELNPSLEFRCFVHDGVVKAICQRDVSRYYGFLSEATMQAKLSSLIKDFLESIVLPRAAATLSLTSFIADVYVELLHRRKDGKCWLVDLSPLPKYRTKKSEPLCDDPPHPLISWEYILGDADEGFFKVVSNRQSVDNSEHKTLAMNRVPLELVQGTITGETIEEAFEKLQTVSKD